MSVVVRMKMPQDGVCDGCDAMFVDFLAGPMCAIKKKFLGSSRPSWCPIICSLPEGHGRMVDADALNRKKKYLIKTENGVFPKSEWFIKANDLFAAKTIVPAEEERRKQDAD